MTTENVTSDQPEQSAAPPAEAAAPPAEAEPVAPESEGEAVATATAEPDKSHLNWYVVKVQSGREESIKDSIERRVKIEALQECFGQIVIPTEKVSEMRKNKRYIRERKLLPGYLMVQVEFNEHMLYLFRETSGVGDFVGAGLNKKPIPMSENEVKKWIGGPKVEGAPVEAKASPYSEGDKVKVKDGMFSGMEGVVKTVLEAKGAVIVELTIFGRPVPVELEYWQVDFA
ncbi:MAG: transcription termination/antitermination factor NusG [Planctomycetes bacterium]|nr:transcription termination/antitermination factor NusG [Planctomycetota bacterium]